VIIKHFEIPKIDLKKYDYFLFYGDNEGLKEEVIVNLFEINYPNKIHKYEEKEILDNKNGFFENVLTKSFFDNEKLIIINRATDKIRITIEELMEKNPTDILFVLNSKKLEKKSTLRKLFEKEKTVICVPDLEKYYKI
jgi:DNA polymerase-3 subunit delta